MADGNYIEITARLNKVVAINDLQKDLNEISKQMLLQLQRVEISQDGATSLQRSLNKIQDNLRLNISGISIDQTQTVKQAQQISQQITNAMNNNSGNGVNRAFDISDSVANSLKIRFKDANVLADTLQKKFKTVGSVTTEVLGHENKLIDQFRVTVTNADGAVEKLVYSLKKIEGTRKHAWEVVSATSSDNNIKLQEQLEKQTIKASDASLRLSNNLESVKQKFAEIVQVHDGDVNIANYLDNAVKAINALNGADSSNFNKLKINAENAIRTYTDYLNKLKIADTQAEQAQRRLDAQLVSTQKTLDHNIMILGNLSKNSVFGKNATSPEVVEMQANVDKLRESYQNLKINTTDSIASPELVGKFKELNVQIVDTIVNSQKLAKTLGDKTTNVVPEVELNNLKTLMNNLKASDVEVDKLKADYGELVGLMIQAQDTGDWSNYLNQLSIFKSKFTEAKSEVKATTAATSELERMAKSLSSNKMNTFFDKNSNNAQVNALKTEINSLINEWTILNSEIQTTGKISPTMATRLEELKAKMQTATTAADTLQKNIKEVANAQKLATQKQSLDTRITSWLQNNTRASQETIVKLKEIQAQIQNADHQTMTNLNSQFREVTANARAAGEAGMRMGDIIKQKLGKFAGWFSIATVVMRSVNELKNMYREVVELDTALVDLRKTTNGTNAELKQFYMDATAIGKNLGVTTKEVIRAASSWSRLGYSLKDAQEMAKTSSIFASISPNMDIEQATDGLVSAMKAYKIEASDALDAIVSKINAVGNSQALNNADIVDFLTRSSSAMAEANNSLEETIALGTAATEITRDAASVGNAMKTVSMRLRGYDEETEQLSDDLKSLSGDIADLTKSTQHPMGVSIFTDETRTTYKSTYQILKDISGIYDELSDKQQAELLEKLAGKRNSQVVAAILNNFDAVNSSIETMQNSAGNAEKEMGVIMDSIEYKTNRFKETAVGIAKDIFQRDSTKNMVDNLTSLLEVINTLTKSVGGLGTALAGLMAYKGFKGQGIFDIFGTGMSSVKGIKNFFTQPVLTKFATNAGLTMADVDALKAFNQQLSQGVTVSRAFEQTMTGSSAAAQSMATSVASGNVAVSQLSVQSRAAAVGIGMLNAAMNVGITLAVSWGITQLTKKLDELIVTEEEAGQQHDELMRSIKNNVEQHNAEQKEIQSLIQEYSKYGECTTYTAEQKEQLKSIQDQLIDTYGLEAEGIDLVNGKYEEQIKLLDENARKKAKENNANLWTAYEESRKGYDNNSGYSFTQTSETKRIGKDKTGYIYNKSELQEAFEGLFEESSKIKRVGYQGNGDVLADQEITFSLRTVDENGNPLDADAMLEQVLAIQDRIDQIRRMSGMQALAQSKEFLDLQAQVAKWTEHYKDEVEENNSALNDLAKNLVLTTSVNIDGVDYYADTVTSDIYNEFSKKLIGAYSKTEPEVAEAIAKYLDDTYGKAFGEVSLSRMEVEVKKAEEYRQRILGSTFDYEDYKDKIEEVEKTVSTLSSAYQKLDANTATASDLGSLFKEFPDLAKYSNDVDTLKEKVRELNNQNVTGLIKSFVELKAKISDPEQLAQLNGWINYLLKLGDLTSKVKEQVSADDYIKYEENNIQNIIDKLEKEKDAQNDILDSLKEQKEELEQIISEYEKTVTAVEKYIDRTQIKPLEQQKSDVEEYYNTQIEKLKEENEERDRNIELQEKQDALANARKTKVRVFSETQGWHYENDVTAVKKAEKELDDLQNSMAIENLEKARNSEVKEIEKQIKSWEEYKDAWKKQVEQINETDEELIASKILGADWQEKISEQNIDVMTNFSSEYVTYNNRLKNQVNVEIANLERVIQSREKEINDWKDYKNQLSDINKNITDSNDDYLKSLNQFVIDENSTWEQRIKHMERNAQIIAKLNGDTNELPETDAKGVLTGSKMWSITKGNEILGLYTSKAEAELNKKKVVEDLVRKQIAPGMPSSIIEVITKRIMETLQIKQYARGGVNSQTGLAWLDGTNTNNEVVFNSAQAKYLYNIVRSGEFGNLVANNILNGIKSNLSSLLGNKQTGGTVNSLNISFPNAVINAKDYDTFKGFMDRYTNDLLLKMQVGL